MVLTEGIAALSSLRSLYEIARDVRNSNDPERLRTAAAQMFDLALAAREQTAALQEERNLAVTELATLKGEVEDTKRFDDEAENYARERTPTGATVYREKNAAGPQGQSPYYCPNCFGNKQLSILNPGPQENTRMGTCAYICPSCKIGMPLYVLRAMTS